MTKSNADNKATLAWWNHLSEEAYKAFCEEPRENEHPPAWADLPERERMRWRSVVLCVVYESRGGAA